MTWAFRWSAYLEWENVHSRKSPTSKGKQYFIIKKVQLGNQRRRKAKPWKCLVGDWPVRWAAMSGRMKRTNYEGIQAEFTLEEEGRGGPTVHGALTGGTQDPCSHSQVWSLLYACARFHFYFDNRPRLPPSLAYVHTLLSGRGWIRSRVCLFFFFFLSHHPAVAN